MAQQELNGILESLQAAHQRKLANAQLQAAAQVNAARQQQEDQRIKLETQRAKDEHDYHQGLMDSAKQLRTLQHQENLQRIKTGIDTSNTMPLGGSFQDGGSFEKGGTIQFPDEEGNQQQYTIDPLAVRAQRIADYQSILDKPKNDAKLTEDAQRAQERMDQIKAAQAEANQRNKDSIEGRNQIAQLVAATRQSIADGKSSGSENDIDPATEAATIHDLLTGATTREQVKALYPGKQAPVMTRIINNASKFGTPVNKQQADAIADLKTRVNNIPQIDNAIQNLPGVLGAAVNAIPGTNQDFKNAVQQLQSNLPRTTLAMSGVKRFNKDEFNMIQGGYIPTAMTPKNQAIKNRDSYYSALNKAAEDLIPGASDVQKTLIKKEIGLDQFHPYSQQQALASQKSNLDAIMPPPGAPQQ